MEKKAFRYRKRIIALIWIIAPSVFIAFVIPEIWDSFAGNIIISVVLVILLWRSVNTFPGVSRSGYYTKTDGVTRIEYEGRLLILDHVNSVFLSDKNSISQGALLQIQNNGKKTVFLSAPMTKSEKVEDTDLYKLFVQIMEENPSMVQEKDIKGEPVRYCYKL